MKIMDIFQDLSQYAVIPVIAIAQADAALPLADALIEGGLPVAEITFRTDAAADVNEIQSNVQSFHYFDCQVKQHLCSIDEIVGV